MQFLAEASTKSQPISLANALPSCVDTSRSVTRSLLLPTSMTGACPPPGAGDTGEERYDAVGELVLAQSLTLWIWLWNLRMREKDAREVML